MTTPSLGEFFALIQTVGAQLRMYEKNHRDKAAVLQNRLAHTIGYGHLPAEKQARIYAGAQEVKAKLEDTLSKAEANRVLAERCEAVLARIPMGAPKIRGKPQDVRQFVAALSTD